MGFSSMCISLLDLSNRYSCYWAYRIETAMHTTHPEHGDPWTYYLNQLQIGRTCSSTPYRTTTGESPIKCSVRETRAYYLIAKELLSLFELNIQHRHSKQHVIPDALSRPPTVHIAADDDSPGGLDEFESVAWSAVWDRPRPHISSFRQRSIGASSTATVKTPFLKTLGSNDNLRQNACRSAVLAFLQEHFIYHKQNCWAPRVFIPQMRLLRIFA